MLDRVLYIRCDATGCKAHSGPHSMLFFDAQQIRIRLKTEGWIQKGSRDYCPKHCEKGGK